MIQKRNFVKMTESPSKIFESSMSYRDIPSLSQFVEQCLDHCRRRGVACAGDRDLGGLGRALQHPGKASRGERNTALRHKPTLRPHLLFRSVQASKLAWLWDKLAFFDQSGRIFADASKIASCARFIGIRTLGRFENEEVASKGYSDRGSRRPTPPGNRSDGNPSRPAARADAR
jgi:hypothetical protein